MRLQGENIILEERDPSQIPSIPYDIEADLLNPQVGEVVALIRFAVIVNDTVIGSCSIYNPEFDEIEFGIELAKEYRNKGYGSEATKVLSDYCLTTMNFSKIHLKVLPYNTRAIRSYEKAGFRRCGKIIINGYEFIKMEKTK